MSECTEVSYEMEVFNRMKNAAGVSAAEEARSGFSNAAAMMAVDFMHSCPDNPAREEALVLLEQAVKKASEALGA